MKLIIAGSRDISNYLNIKQHLYTAFSIYQARSENFITEIVSGGARGIDQLGEELADKLGLSIRKFIVTNEEWMKSRGAGHDRNKRMAEYADGLLAVWDGESPGTRHMISEAIKRRMPTLVWFIKTGAYETWNM